MQTSNLYNSRRKNRHLDTFRYKGKKAWHLRIGRFEILIRMI